MPAKRASRRGDARRSGRRSQRGDRRRISNAAEQEGLIEGEERRLLQSIVDFGDTLVREVMTPRPDIVAIRETATIGDLRALFREQEYSRFPVFKESLDNIAGFVFVKDLVALDTRDDSRPITPLLRPAVIVPESKRVPELLKQFQRQQTQIAIVVDEYGGTAGLVTIEDLLEEIVGEIRDEYDVESEPIVDEGGGRFVFNGKVDIDEVMQRLGVQIEREGFETVGGYLLTHLGRVPAVGERVDIDGLTVEVLEVDRRRVNKVRICSRRAEVRRRAGTRMKSGFVSFIGRPNAGKSTLLNRLVGSKLAIVSDKPQTTRTRILGVRNYPDAQVVFLDTPGIHRPLHRMNVRMVDTAVETISEVDVLGLVVDATEAPGKGDRFVLDLVKNAQGAGLPDPEQDRSGQEAAAAADHRAVSAGRAVRRDHPGLGRDRRERRPARAGAHRSAAGRASGCIPTTT